MDNSPTEPDSRSDRPESSPFERFQSLTKRLLRVPPQEVREAEAREREKRRTA